MSPPPLLASNGRWRSVWNLVFNPNELNKTYDLEGQVRVQVHYYEDGNGNNGSNGGSGNALLADNGNLDSGNLDNGLDDFVDDDYRNDDSIF